MAKYRHFFIALAISALLHLALLLGPVWRLALGSDDPPAGIRIDAHILTARAAPANKAPRRAAPAPGQPDRPVSAAPRPEEHLSNQPSSEDARAAEKAVNNVTDQGTGTEVPPLALPAKPTDAASAQSSSPLPFSTLLASASEGRLQYRVMLGEKGLWIGRLVQTWKRDGDRYQVESVTETVGLAVLFKVFKLVQRSRGQIGPLGLVPEEFGADQIEEEGSRMLTRFDWSARRLRMDRDGQKSEAVLESGSQDFISFIYQLVLHPPVGKTDMYIATGKAYNRYSLEYRGDEPVASPIGQLQARHYATVGPPGERSTEIWLAEELGYLPVRLKFVDGKGKVLDTELQSVDFGAVNRKAPNPPN